MTNNKSSTKVSFKVSRFSDEDIEAFLIETKWRTRDE